LSHPSFAYNIFPRYTIEEDRCGCRLQYRLDHRIHLGPKPLATSIDIMALYSTLSKAFSKSSFKIIIDFFDE
jgi:hypothetical protein